jgi:osmotically-inducible protein OsmY
VRSKDINVVVNGAVATLTGTVRTWIGWNEADKDARKAGATAVLNQVKVKQRWWW